MIWGSGHEEGDTCTVSKLLHDLQGVGTNHD